MKIQLVRALSGRRRAPVRWLIVAVITLLSSAAGIEFHRAGAAAEFNASIVAQSTGFLIFVNSTGDGNNTVAAPNCDADAVTPGAQCTLRAALQASNLATGDDAIEFVIPTTEPNCDSMGKCVISLTRALPDLSTNVELIGPGPDKLTVRRDSTDPFRIFNVTTSGTVRFSGLTISDGTSGIFNGSDSSLMLTNIVISGNTTRGFGAGISNSGTLTIANSTISDNFGGDEGGGVYNDGTLTIANSTVSGNQCDQKGGGIYNKRFGTVTITNSTLSRNWVRQSSIDGGGGGIFNDEFGTLMITNTTISGNLSASFFGAGILNRSFFPVSIKSSIIAAQAFLFGDVLGDFNSAGFNLIGMTDGSTGFTQPTDLTGTSDSPLDPGVDPNGLKDNGGPTKTIALLCDSPATDKGTSVGLTGNLLLDQRGTGFARTFDDSSISNATDGDGTDIGAFEVQESPHCNHQPEADAGPDQTVECGGGTTPVMLDGSASFDLDNDPLAYSWSEGGVEIATGVKPTVYLSNGIHTLTLAVTDPFDAFDTDQVVVTIQDSTGPGIIPTTGTLRLYPANHNYVTFTIANLVGTVSYACDSTVDLSNIVIAQVSSDEPEDAKGNGDGSTKNDMVISNDCKSVLLRAERADQLDGRVYSVVLKAKDSTGNILQATRKIFVPVSRKASAVDSGTAGYSVTGCTP